MKHRLVLIMAGAGVPVDTVTLTGPASAVVTYQAGQHLPTTAGNS